MSPKPLHILITAGPTREYLDSVRYISNPSSGKMGFAIAAVAARRGHHVTLVSGPMELKPPASVNTVRVETAAEMLAAARRAFRCADAAVFCAAVCDYRPLNRARRKLPKSQAALTLKLTPTPDIAATLGRVKGRRISIAFALEDHDGRRKAEAKMIAKHADAIVLNGPINIGSDRATVEILRHGGDWTALPSATKPLIAKRLIELVEQIAGECGRAAPSRR
ncbi:MAG: phosphopantothenoylcysteine decarboxylase [Phycisphaerae bacterium]|nr:phosphopantothenoylcysteine decarboxylase [Phycisphaerae bacterium]